MIRKSRATSEDLSNIRHRIKLFREDFGSKLVGKITIEGLSFHDPRATDSAGTQTAADMMDSCHRQI